MSQLGHLRIGMVLIYLLSSGLLRLLLIGFIIRWISMDGFKKYDDPEATEQARLQKIIDMEKVLFGNETPVGDALAHKYARVVPEMDSLIRRRKANEQRI
jgi:hypothetical protein